MEIQHWSHEHSLIFGEKNDDEGFAIFCYGCRHRISSTCAYYYCCKSCSFFLHKSCAELPGQMEHSMHSEHPLTLLPRFPYKWCPFATCDACEKYVEGFTYVCFTCDFRLDASCATRKQSIKHKSHKHPLSLVLSAASFKCNGCGTQREGLSYMCNFCSFWIHEECASLPTTFNHGNHVHPLTLTFTCQIREFLLQEKCYICEKGFTLGLWNYQCAGCSFKVHVDCSKKNKVIKAAIRVDDLDMTNLIQLPVPDESIYIPIDQILRLGLRDTNMSEKSVELNHSNHIHPLALFNMHSNENLCSLRKSSILNEHKYGKICYACVQPISAPFYYCKHRFCNFFLHKWCAELPNEIQHPLHPHPLSLIKNRWGFFKCSCCGKQCDEFSFCCSMDVCDEYYLDVSCALLLCSIMHEVHEHPLHVRPNCTTEGCVACDQCNGEVSFGCGSCNFNLHYNCALLPSTIKHRYDKHPFTLTYAPIEDGPEEYICEFCENDMDPKWWFYHCIDCDQSACTKCIRQKVKENSIIKKGLRIKRERTTIGSHPPSHRFPNINSIMPSDSRSLKWWTFFAGAYPFLYCRQIYEQR